MAHPHDNLIRIFLLNCALWLSVKCCFAKCRARKIVATFIMLFQVNLYQWRSALYIRRSAIARFGWNKRCFECGRQYRCQCGSGGVFCYLLPWGINWSFGFVRVGRASLICCLASFLACRILLCKQSNERIKILLKADKDHPPPPAPLCALPPLSPAPLHIAFLS